MVTVLIGWSFDTDSTGIYFNFVTIKPNNFDFFPWGNRCFFLFFYTTFYKNSKNSSISAGILTGRNFDIDSSQKMQISAVVGSSVPEITAPFC